MKGSYCINCGADGEMEGKLGALCISTLFVKWIHQLTQKKIFVKGIPGCFYTRAYLLKSSNNLQMICNNVSIKCSRLIFKRILSVTSTFTVLETYTKHVNPKNLKVIIFQCPCI